MEKFLLIIMVHSQFSILRESKQYVTGPVRHARNIYIVAPVFQALIVKVESIGETTRIDDVEQDGWVQTANASMATEAKTGFWEG